MGPGVRMDKHKGILYLSDLDGTLLNSNERVSEYTANIINCFIQKGGCFSYATARSFVTASKVTSGLSLKHPVICGNGGFIHKNTGEILLSNFFTSNEVTIISSILMENKIYPVVYGYVDGKERFSYIKKYVTYAMQYFLNSRLGDPRIRIVDSTDELYSGNIADFSCMDTDHVLFPISKIFDSDNRFNTNYQREIYSGGKWLNIQPIKTTKANAALQLKSMLGCDKLVVFGDERNDLSMFEVADEKYAMSNAVPELKEIATAVIDSNDNDGVANWIVTCL